MTAWLSFWGVSFLFPFLLGFTAWIWKWSHDSICFSTQSFLFLPGCACLFPFICPALPFLRYFFYCLDNGRRRHSFRFWITTDGRRSLFLFLYSMIFFLFSCFPHLYFYDTIRLVADIGWYGTFTWGFVRNLLPISRNTFWSVSQACNLGLSITIYP